MTPLGALTVAGSSPGAIAVTRERFKGWDAWRLARGPLELLVVPQVGGRIMGLRWRGWDLAFTQPEREGHVENVAAVVDLPAHKRAMGFPLWGGDKTWLAPQERWTESAPFLDLDSGPYRAVFDDGPAGGVALRLTSAVCRETGVEIERRLALRPGEAGWRLGHRLTNYGAGPVEWAVWDVLMLKRPGRVYLPRHPASVYPRGLKTFEAEGSLCDLGACAAGELGGLTVVRCEQPRAFKAGVDAVEGWMLGVVDTPVGLVGCVKRAATFPGARYPHGCAAEVFNAERYDYLEVELLGPMVRLAPGDSFVLEERAWLVGLDHWPSGEAEVRYLVTQGDE